MKTVIMMCWLIIITIMASVGRIDLAAIYLLSLRCSPICLPWLCFISDLRLSSCKIICPINVK